MEGKLLLLLPVIQAGNQGGVCRPVHGDGTFLHGGAVQGKVQPAPLREGLGHSPRRRLLHGPGLPLD